MSNPFIGKTVFHVLVLHFTGGVEDIHNTPVLSTNWLLYSLMYKNNFRFNFVLGGQHLLFSQGSIVVIFSVLGQISAVIYIHLPSCKYETNGITMSTLIIRPILGLKGVFTTSKLSSLLQYPFLS